MFKKNTGMNKSRFVECIEVFQGSSGRRYEKGEVFPVVKQIRQRYCIISVDGSEVKISTRSKYFKYISEFEYNLKQILK